MKPHLLLVLLLAIPPLIANVLSYQNAEPSDAPSPTEKTSRVPAKEKPVPAPEPVPAAAAVPAATSAPAPTSRSGTSGANSATVKAWYMM